MERKVKLINSEIYHIMLRAVGDSTIFNDENDFYRAIFSLYEFNNANSVEIWLRRKQRKKEKLLGSPTSQRDLLVEILLFSFMPNHIHLLLRQLKDDGISRFMQKVGTGYANYFNKKYNRKGHLFNKFKSIHIKDDDQLRTIFNYIHANPISLVEPGWKENGIKNQEAVIGFLKNYRWSSYQDYTGKSNFSSITTRNFMSSLIGGESGCRNAIEDWVKHKTKLKDFDSVFLE